MDDIRATVGNNPYSLLIDESSDIGKIEYLGIAIIYYDYQTKKVVCTFLALSPIESCTSIGIVNCLKATINKVGLDLCNLDGIGTDNASAMVGINNGVYQLLKKEIPGLILIRCVCHSIQLAVSAAAKIAFPRNLEFLISETYNWFSNSPKRLGDYKSLYNTINDGLDPKKIIKSCDTCWLSVSPAVRRIDNQWLELKTHFGIARLSERCYKAELLHEMYNDDTNKAYIMFLIPILDQVERLNFSFESNQPDPTILLDDITMVIKSLVNRICLPAKNIDPFEGNIETALDPKPYLGHKFENKLKEMRQNNFHPEREFALRSRCINFLQNLIKELRQRLPDNVKILQKMSQISIRHALNPVSKQDLIPIMELMHVSPEIIDRVEFQWRSVHLVQWTEHEDTIAFWGEVAAFKDASGSNPFKELADFSISLLILPHSNAEVERVFSQMNLVKNKLRNRMQAEM
ncbi:unnamed protein product, partial [Meganyctiphanes norvegica]